MSEFTPGPMSKCNKCGARWPSAPPGVVHKCQCSGGMCYPESPTTSLPEPAEEGSTDTNRPCTFGQFLKLARHNAGLSLRAVEEATGKEVSNAYLCQLESGKIKNPSPRIFHALSMALAVPYETLMQQAGYVPATSDGNEFVPAYSAVETAKHYAELAGGVFVPFMTESEGRASTAPLTFLRSLGIIRPDPTPLDIAKAEYPEIPAEKIERIMQIAGGK